MHDPFAQRRARLLAQMQAAGGGIAIIGTAPEVHRNGGVHYPYRHDSTFYYLSGFTEPEALLVLKSAGTQQHSILFCREKVAERELWEGFRYGPAEARTRFGFDEAHPLGALAQMLPALLADAPAVFYTHDSDALAARVRGWLGDVRTTARGGAPVPDCLRDLARLTDEMRVFKDDAEIARMQASANVAAGAHVRAMQAARAGMHEYEIEAELLYAFRRGGAQAPAFSSIVAAGANACVLHYEANNAVCGEGELVLIDAGCELDSYASDISRTFPVSGRFSAPQRELYELVLAAQTAALAAVRPGRPYIEGHEQAVRVLAAGMLDLGLLKRKRVGSLEDVIDSKAYQQFYMHGSGHWLGLDVHDVGQYRLPNATPDGERPYRQLEAGMVLTVEPGIYVRPAKDVPEQYWNTGIRIEDDVLVTPDGHRVLSAAAPKTVAEIEALLAQK